MISLYNLNQMSQDEFTETLGAIFEDTPDIASKAWCKRPFQSLEDLYQAMIAIVEQMAQAEQLALICAHPDLGSKARMADASVQEQAGVGLNRLTEAEYNRFQRLNQAYKQKFGFPFIIAVKNHTKATILNAFELRLENTVEEERQQALREINTIALFRLQALSDGS
ncbi:MAG: 2-oxo-4-hydroxy-4-carboxy-5-ureidoimidazoline decarboxylase [Microcystaceae cyanobacterium]